MRGFTPRKKEASWMQSNLRPCCRSKLTFFSINVLYQFKCMYVVIRSYTWNSITFYWFGKAKFDMILKTSRESNLETLTEEQWPKIVSKRLPEGCSPRQSWIRHWWRQWQQIPWFHRLTWRRKSNEPKITSTYRVLYQVWGVSSPRLLDTNAAHNKENVS